MTMEGSYAWEKLQIAVDILAEDLGTLRDRFEDAYVSSLMLLQPDKHFPWPDLRQSYEDLMRDLVPDGSISAALSERSEEDLQRIADGIVSLNDRVLRRMNG
jgi:hypothetical protein